MDYAQLFLRLDDPGQFTCPKGFDSDAAESRFEAFVGALSGEMGTTLEAETGVHIQDASFHSQVFLPLSGDKFALIRFSSFGNMASVSDDELVPEATMSLVTELLARHGYTYIPARILETPYTGKYPDPTRIHTWWIRYFDWA